MQVTLEESVDWVKKIVWHHSILRDLNRTKNREGWNSLSLLELGHPSSVLDYSELMVFHGFHIQTELHTGSPGPPFAEGRWWAFSPSITRKAIPRNKLFCSISIFIYVSSIIYPLSGYLSYDLPIYHRSDFLSVSYWPISLENPD